MRTPDETERLLRQQVQSFYGRVRDDTVLGPVFNYAIDDWSDHLEKLGDFWSSIVLTSGKYKGQPVPAHRRHAARISPEMFDHWLALWADTASEILPEDLAALVITKSQRISGNIGAELTLQLASGELTIAPNVYFSSAFFQTSTADPLLQQDGFAKVDLRLGYQTADQRWTFSIIGKNLTDKTTAGFRQPITLAFGSTSAFIDPPRTVAFQMNYQF